MKRIVENMEKLPLDQTRVIEHQIGFVLEELGYKKPQKGDQWFDAMKYIIECMLDMALRVADKEAK